MKIGGWGEGGEEERREWGTKTKITFFFFFKTEDFSHSQVLNLLWSVGYFF